MPGAPHSEGYFELANGPAAAYRAAVKRGDIARDRAQEGVARALDALAQRLSHYRGPRKGVFGIGAKTAPRGLYIHGEVGRGKSMLMDLFHDSVSGPPKRRAHFHEFMQDVHAQVKHLRETHPGDPLPRVARAIADEALLLCFDEFHVSDIADAMILGRLFGALFDLGVVVVATSNRAPDALYKDGINRQLFLPFIAMLKKKLQVMSLDGPMDYRLAKAKGFDTYLTPLGPATDAKLDAAFRSLTGFDAGKPQTLKVQGRKLVIREAAKGVARASFAELCGQPLGAADYLTLARTFHTLVLSGVPQMGPAERNEAKRFVTLIDVLYEQKVKLVCGAAASPDALYPQGDGAFEFGRTASRLIEMQSPDYLALAHKAA